MRGSRRGGGRVARAAACLAVLAACAAEAAGQGRSVSIAGPAGNPLREATPRFVVTTSGFTAADAPVALRLQVALSADFAAPFYADTTVTGTSATIVIPRLLPPGITVWWRVIARTATGVLVASDADGPRRTPPWLTLLSPNNLNGATLNTPRPFFQWTSPALIAPVARWRYFIVITRSADAAPVLTGTLADTVFQPPSDLESNTSFRWAVTAVAGTGDSVRVISASSFVITSANAPIATVLFQPFPNPFPNERLPATCIWFDLRRQSDIRLDVLDLRGNRVATILPGRGLGGTLPPGRYGRAVLGSDSGCDDRLTWNGMDDRGRLVPPGVYLVRFSGDGVSETRKVLFRGR